MFQNTDEEVSMKYQGNPKIQVGTGVGTIPESDFVVPAGKRWIVDCVSYQIASGTKADTAHVHIDDGSLELQLDFGPERDVGDANLCFGGQFMVDSGWTGQIHTKTVAYHNHQIKYLGFDK